MPLTSLLTNDQKTFIDGLFDVPFETFKRPIKIVTEGNTVVMSTNPNFNYTYQNKNKNVTVQTTEGVYDVVVDYSPTVTDQLLAQNPDLKVQQQQGLVRLSVPANVAELIRKAKDIQFDGHSYELKTGDIPRGMFNTFNYFDFWIIRKS